jgi:hypothetical protein
MTYRQTDSLRLTSSSSCGIKAREHETVGV